jgi:hypothetical protein
LAKKADGAALKGASEMEGVERIAAERQRQITQEGWTPEHDAEHESGELGQAAVCYINHACPVDWEIHAEWPWLPSWWKPSADPIRDLEKAGALIAAEIDRLLRDAEAHRHDG